jgi:osmotically-inducible protein OsmY
MRSLVFLLFAITLVGCSGLMMGGNASQSAPPPSGPSESERAANLQKAADASITSAIQRRFSSDPVLGDGTVYVKSTNAMVRLSGSVPSYEAREKAEKLAMATDGVAGVENKITVEFSN